MLRFLMICLMLAFGATRRMTTSMTTNLLWRIEFFEIVRRRLV